FGEQLESRRIGERSRDPGLIADVDRKLVVAWKARRSARRTLTPGSVGAIAFAFLRPPFGTLSAALARLLLPCSRLLVTLFSLTGSLARPFLSCSRLLVALFPLTGGALARLLLSCSRLLVALFPLTGSLFRALLSRSGFFLPRRPPALPLP